MRSVKTIHKHTQPNQLQKHSSILALTGSSLPQVQYFLPRIEDARGNRHTDRDFQSCLTLVLLKFHMSCGKTPSVEKQFGSSAKQAETLSLLAHSALQCTVHHLAVSAHKTHHYCFHSAWMAHQARLFKRKDSFMILGGHAFPRVSPLKTMFVQRLTTDLTVQSCKQHQMNLWFLLDHE